MSNVCPVCEEQIEPTEAPHIIEHADQPTAMHEICYWKATAGMLTSQVSKIEATIENGNRIVGILAALLVDLIEYTEMGANWAIKNQIETDVKKIDFLTRRVNEAKKIAAQFKVENEIAKKLAAKRDLNSKPHICSPMCKH